MKIKYNISSTWLIIFLTMALLLSVAFDISAEEKDDEESLIGKAGSQLLESMPDFFKDVTALQKMTDQEKVNYILTQAENRIKEKVADKFKEDMLKKAEEYAKESLRAKLFLEIGVPKIRHAYTMGEAFNWDLIDSEIASKLDTKINALSAGIKAAKIGWAAYEAYSDGDMLAAAKSISGSISELLAEAYIPGWGYIKLGAAMVEALGNYVLSYATETALAGMLEDMYGMKANPQTFAQWLIDKTPAQIEADIRDKWNWGAGYGRVWEGQGTDKGDEEMMGRIKTTLMTLRGELLLKKKEQEQKEQQVQRDIEKYLEPSRRKQKEVQATAQKVKDEANKYLSQIEKFKTHVLKIQQEKANERIWKNETEMAKESTTEIFASINPDEILSLFRLYYDEIKDNPGKNGYDREKMSRLWTEATAKRYNNEKEARQSIHNQYDRARQALRNQFEPQLNALYARIEAARASHSPQSLISELEAQYNTLNSQYTEAIAKLQKAYAAADKKLSIEIAILDQKLLLENTEAQKREETLAKRIKEGMDVISNRILQANRELGERKGAWVSKVQTKLRLPELVLSEAIPEVVACANICGPAGEVERGAGIKRYSPGELYNGVAQAKDLLDRLKRDLAELSDLFNEKKEIYKKYQSDILNQRVQFNSLVPQNLQRIPSEGIGVPEQEGKGMEERVKNYGIRSVAQESWGAWAGGFSTEVLGLMNRKGISVRRYFETPPIEIPTKYFDHQLTEMDIEKKFAQERYQKAINFLEKNISILEYYASVDAITVSINRIAPPVFNALRPYLRRPSFGTKNNVPGYDFPAYESDGAKFLTNMKNAWEANRAKIEKLVNLKKAYGKGISYIKDDPSELLKELEDYVTFPAHIAQYEKDMEEAEKKRLSLLGEAEKDLKKLQDMLVEVKKEPTGIRAVMTIDNLKKQLPHYLGAPPGSIYHALRDKFLAFQKEIDEYLAERERYLKELAARQKREEEEERRRQEEALRQMEQEKVALLARENQLIRDFYNRFKQAYESRNESQVVSFLGDRWEAGDGTTISDLRLNLSRSFKTFDEIRYNIQNLNLERKEDGIYRVSYDVTISSRIFRRNIKHEEKSSVIEEVMIEKSGRVKVFRTLSGRFWYTH